MKTPTESYCRCRPLSTATTPASPLAQRTSSLSARRQTWCVELSLCSYQTVYFSLLLFPLSLFPFPLFHHDVMAPPGSHLLSRSAQTKARIVLNMVVTMFSEYCADKFSVQPVAVLQADGTKDVYPVRACSSTCPCYLSIYLDLALVLVLLLSLSCCVMSHFCGLTCCRRSIIGWRRLRAQISTSAWVLRKTRCAAPPLSLHAVPLSLSSVR